MGFFFGFAGFLLLPTRDVVLSQSALLAAFTGPFFGMARARYMRQRRERNKARAGCGHRCRAGLARVDPLGRTVEQTGKGVGRTVSSTFT